MPAFHIQRFSLVYRMNKVLGLFQNENYLEAAAHKGVVGFA